MGQALYRTHRSKSLDEVVGQEHITTALKHALEQGTLSHAYLFTGPRGVGKTSVARILAHAVNDLPYSDESTHLDIIEIDAASNRRIDEIRELRDKVNIAPSSAKYKVYIIDEVHMLTREAFNALLKTLEEPPQHVIFILATTEAHKLPETIISRTQRFSFKPISPAIAIEHLKSIAKSEKINIDDAALELIAQHGNGSFRDSISLLDQVRNQAGKVSSADVLAMLGEAPADMITKLLRALAQQSSIQLVEVLQNLREQGFEPARIAKQLGASLRQNLLDGEAPLPAQQTLQLLSRLIEVPAARDQLIALEIALLQSITADPQPVQQKAAASPPKPKAEPPSQPDNQIKEEEPAPVEKPAAKVKANSAELDDELWNQAVELIKEEHNTLYGVVRMARPSWQDAKLTLAFAFPFHQKRINDPKHREIIAGAIKELSGQDVEVVCVVDPSIKNEILSTEVVNRPDDNENIASISNIFGGAELLES